MNKIFVAFAAAAIAAVSLPAVAADLPARMPVKAPIAAPSPAYNWSGFYFGVHAGYGWGELTSAADTTIDHEPTGGLFGGQIGYNWQSGQFVFGIEADFAFSTIDGDDISTAGGFTTLADHDMKFLGTARGRIGLAHDRVLFYATGGFAWARVEGRLNVLTVGTGSDEITLTGWTAGGGLEFAFTRNLSARIEYLYVDFQKEPTTITIGGFPLADQADSSLNIVRFGLNYRL